MEYDFTVRFETEPFIMPCTIVLQRIIGRFSNELFYIIRRIYLNRKTAAVHNRYVVVHVFRQRYDIHQFTVAHFDSHFITENQDIEVSRIVIAGTGKCG